MMLPAMLQHKRYKTRIMLSPKYEKRHQDLQVCISLYILSDRGCFSDLMYT